MLVDSHCHLNFPELAAKVDEALALMRENRVTHALCVSVTLEDFPQVRALAERYPNVYGSVGVHPDYPDVPVVSEEELVALAAHPRIVAIGETGLDYFRIRADEADWQRDRFRTHIRAGLDSGLPLVIHTRSSSRDTLEILKEEGAGHGVFHCFTESMEVARAAVEMGFFISFSGILTFKSARELQEVARWVPLDRCLIETDSPYLAPHPFRGKTNTPAWVPYVAQQLADLKGCSLETVAQATTANFDRLFPRVLN